MGLLILAVAISCEKCCKKFTFLLVWVLHVHEENVEVDKEEELQIIRQMIFSSFKKIR